MKADDGNHSIRYTCRARFRDQVSRTMSWIFTFDPKGGFVSVKEVEALPRGR